ncbi:MAG: Uma2 family endonuclease [Acidobacteriota bacterium]
MIRDSRFEIDDLESRISNLESETMRQANVRFNYHDYQQLPEDKRYEILNGELFVVPAPNIRHQRVAIRLQLRLFQHVEKNGLGELLEAPCDVLLSEENVVQPDILFVAKARLRIIGKTNIPGAPDLVVEILSPGTRQKDLAIKRKIYARFGVQEYWIVDPDASTVEVLIREKSGYITAGIYRESDRLSSPLLPKLNLPLREIFA